MKPNCVFLAVKLLSLHCCAAYADYINADALTYGDETPPVYNLQPAPDAGSWQPPIELNADVFPPREGRLQPDALEAESLIASESTTEDVWFQDEMIQEPLQPDLLETEYLREPEPIIETAFSQDEMILQPDELEPLITSESTTEAVVFHDEEIQETLQPEVLETWSPIEPWHIEETATFHDEVMQEMLQHEVLETGSPIDPWYMEETVTFHDEIIQKTLWPEVLETQPPIAEPTISALTSPVESESTIAAVTSPVEPESIAAVTSPVEPESIAAVTSPVEPESIAAVTSPVEPESIAAVTSPVGSESTVAAVTSQDEMINEPTDLPQSQLGNLHLEKEPSTASVVATANDKLNSGENLNNEEEEKDTGSDYEKTKYGLDSIYTFLEQFKDYPSWLGSSFSSPADYLGLAAILVIVFVLQAIRSLPAILISSSFLFGVISIFLKRPGTLVSTPLLILSTFVITVQMTIKLRKAYQAQNNQTLPKTADAVSTDYLWQTQYNSSQFSYGNNAAVYPEDEEMNVGSFRFNK